MPNYKPTPLLFLDLDQTVRFNTNNPDGFIKDPTEVEIYPGVVEMMKDYKSKGWRIVSISNQGGIALGHLSEGINSRIMAETNRLCANLFDRMLWCSHYPELPANKKETLSRDDQYEAAHCWCRKPRIGMLIAAAMSLSEQHNEFYRPFSSLFVGDRDEDEKCAQNANIQFVLAKAWRDNWIKEGVIITPDYYKEDVASQTQSSS